jgi:hypothetical protein
MVLALVSGRLMYNRVDGRGVWVGGGRGRFFVILMDVIIY